MHWVKFDRICQARLKVHLNLQPRLKRSSVGRVGVSLQLGWPPVCLGWEVPRYRISRARTRNVPSKLGHHPSPGCRCRTVGELNIRIETGNQDNEREKETKPLAYL